MISLAVVGASPAALVGKYGDPVHAEEEATSLILRVFEVVCSDELEA